MFTGIIEEVGEVVQLTSASSSAVLRVRAATVGQDVKHGASIAVNGVCLTVIGQRPAEADPGVLELEFDVMAETLRRCGDELTRANVMKQAASLKDFTPDTLLPGVKINTSATDFAPIAQLQMQRFKGQKWELFGEIISGDIATQ